MRFMLYRFRYKQYGIYIDIFYDFQNMQYFQIIRKKKKNFLINLPNLPIYVYIVVVNLLIIKKIKKQIKFFVNNLKTLHLFFLLNQ